MYLSLLCNSCSALRLLYRSFAIGSGMSLNLTFLSTLARVILIILLRLVTFSIGHHCGRRSSLMAQTIRPKLVPGKRLGGKVAEFSGGKSSTCTFIFSRSRSVSGGRRKRSETPKPTKVHVAHLTRNVTKDHVNEIFSFFGTIKSVDLPTERSKTWIGTGSAYVDYEKPEMAEEAVKKMNGGKILQ